MKKYFAVALAALTLFALFCGCAKKTGYAAVDELKRSAKVTLHITSYGADSVDTRSFDKTLELSSGQIAKLRAFLSGQKLEKLSVNGQVHERTEEDRSDGLYVYYIFTVSPKDGDVRHIELQSWSLLKLDGESFAVDRAAFKTFFENTFGIGAE